MKKLLSPMLFALFVLVFVLPAAMGVCPVCTVAVGAGLEGARLLGVADVITGIWAGGLTLSLVAWTANYMTRRGVSARIWYVLNFVAYYAILALVYFIPTANPIVRFNQSCIWGIDQFMMGVIVGTIVFYLMARWYLNIKAKNGGHAQFPFQKVVWPLGGLLIATLIFWALLKWLPAVGLVLC